MRATKRRAVLLTGLLCAGTVCTQSYPAKPIRIVVPITAGGTGETLARFVAERLADAFKQQVIVENRAGANGIIGTKAVVKAAPDGYTLVAVSVEFGDFIKREIVKWARVIREAGTRLD